MTPNSFFVLDIETTGFDPAWDDVFEFSAVRLDAQGQVAGQLDMLLSANQAVSPLVQSLTGITPSMLAGMPKLEDVKAQIEDFVGDLPIVGHNINFDVDFLVAKGLRMPGDRLDTLELAQTILPAQPGYGLEQLSHRWGFSHQPSHRAMNDVMATVDLFLFLASQAIDLDNGTKTAIGRILQGQNWPWAWLFSADLPSFATTQTHEHTVSEYTQYLVADLGSIADAAGAINSAATEKINLIETHLAPDMLVQAVGYSALAAPALLVVPANLLRQIKWQELGAKIGQQLKTFSVVEHQIADLKPDLVKSVSTAQEVTPALIRLAIKLTLWQHAWQQRSNTLFLTSDEYYEWEQKIVDSKTPETFQLAQDGIWVITPDQLAKINNISDFKVVTAHPHHLEESFFDTQTRTFSVPYFNAAVSSRRDFIHREIMPENPKDADELFKILSAIGPRLGKLTELLTSAYAQNPPTNAFDKDIELNRSHFTLEFDQLMGDLVANFQHYLTKLQAVGLDSHNHQVERTTKLLQHLTALKHFDPGYKYFLFAEPNRFFLQVIPNQNIFAALQSIFDQAKQVTIISAGLVFKGSFNYWQTIFPKANAKLITGTAHQIMQVSDSRGDNFNDIVALVARGLEQKKEYSIGPWLRL